MADGDWHWTGRRRRTSWIVCHSRERYVEVVLRSRDLRLRGRHHCFCIWRPLRAASHLPPVAVLIGERTASSGEAVLVAFQARDQTKTFGHPTGGYTTAIRRFPLRDGARLYLAVATFADRSGHVYRGRIYPDLRPDTVPPETPTYKDPIVDTARRWIENQPGC